MLLISTLGCGTRTENELQVLAAASLSEVFEEIASDFEDATGTPVRVSFAGSQVLAAQLNAGIRADAVAVANPSITARLHADGLVELPVRFASNQLVWVTRRQDVPAVLDADLLRQRLPDLRIVLAAPEVPAGEYSRRALARLGLLEVVSARLVSQELDVKGVISKLLLAGADAGIAYATDVNPEHRGQLRVQSLPVEVRASYLAASASPAGRDFVEFLQGPSARERLAAYGFGGP